VATALAVLCVMALVAAVVLAVVLRNGAAAQDRVEADRAEVVQATQRFVETWNTFEPGQAEDYVASVEPLLTTKFRKQFTDAAQDVITGITQQKLRSTGAVLSDTAGIPLVGIATMDSDSAEVLVVSDATRVANGQRVQRHWRWQVELEKVDGEWLVDRFEEV